ncbi:DUF4142 domain-containing protein [Anabaena sphaerica FACHB-251]|uniref:DUF4142 domain-containing protein n=1 Tax=Anabaena sphaerica FACHB-251 TaxID=2692883 RepID=A0A926WMX7_9NOST|nr:DUF4142 domain-containing protein [Anabaena sphaerica]MBD2296714.1 DUF4142 domain-containing protein [Anabaena sphaerica FACHB-251]
MKKQPIVMTVLLTASIFTFTYRPNNALAQSHLIPIKLTQNNVSQSDRQFVTKAAQGNLAEVELGQLATERGQSNEVKAFGQLMVDDHRRLNQELEQLAAQKGIDFPTDIGSENNRVRANLQKLSGSAFDTAYIRHMIEDHNKDIALYRRQSQQGNDQDLKNWAARSLALLQEHLRLATSIQDSLPGRSRR